MSASATPRAAAAGAETRTHLRRARSMIKGASADLAPVLTAVMLIAPVAAAALLYVWTRVATVHLGYELSRAGAKHQALLEENRGLRIEVASLKAPERLTRLAIEQYKLAPPKSPQVIRMSEGTAQPSLGPSASLSAARTPMDLGK